MNECAPPPKQRRPFFWKFSLDHKETFRAHWEEGKTLGSKKDIEAWRNVGEHCLVAGAFAALLATRMGLPPDRIKAVTNAMILHDWYKKHETLARKRAGTTQAVRDVIDAVKKEDQQKLAARGYPADVIALTGANLPASAEGPQTDEEKVIWYVDAMLTDTTPVPIKQRFDDLEQHPTRGAANKAFSESYRPVYGRSLYEVQRALGDTVGTHLAQRIGYTGDVNDLPLHLRELLMELITSGDWNAIIAA